MCRGKKRTKHEHRFSSHSVNILKFAETCFSGRVCEAGEMHIETGWFVNLEVLCTGGVAVEDEGSRRAQGGFFCLQ